MTFNSPDFKEDPNLEVRLDTREHSCTNKAVARGHWSKIVERFEITFSYQLKIGLFRNPSRRYGV